MLIRFLRTCHLKGTLQYDPAGLNHTFMPGHQWIDAGARSVARILADRGETVDVQIYTDSFVGVPKDAFETLEDRALWDGEVPRECELCHEAHPEPAIWHCRDKCGVWRVLCNGCFASDENSDHGFALGPGLGGRYERDPEDGTYVKTTA